MRIIKRKLLLLAAACLWVLPVQADDVEIAKASDIAGDWLVNSGDAVIRFYEQQGSYHGKVVWAGRESEEWWFGLAPVTIPWNDKKSARKLKHAPTLGVDVLTGLRFDGVGKWLDGRIFNVLNGKIYQCQVSLEDDGRLKLRGFIGLPVIGGNVYWTRLEDSARASMPSFPNRFAEPDSWP